MFKDRVSCHKLLSSHRKAEQFDYTVKAARHYISLFPQISSPNEEQNAMLAAAHYTLALQKNIPISHCKMHTNATITLLQKLKQRNQTLNSMIAKAYCKRAELFEKDQAFQAASQDYQKALEVFDDYQAISTLCDQDKLLVAQCAISLADLMLSQTFDSSAKIVNHPLFYVNKALGFLSELPKTQDEIWTTLSYAHQIAGIALSSIDIADAKEAFRTAIVCCFKTEPKMACNLLGDIYNCLGIIYEQQFWDCPIQKKPQSLSDQAMIYFSIALLFKPKCSTEFEPETEHYLLQNIFDLIYRSLDPYISPLSNTVIRDFIDALIFTYYCVSDKLLINQSLCQQLSDSHTFDSFAQHIFLLVFDMYRREHYRENLLDCIKPCDYDLSFDLSHSLASLLNNRKNNIHYL